MRAFLRDLPAPTIRLYLLAMLLVAPLALGQVVPAFMGVAAAGGGLYRFGSITLRWRTPLGLLWRQRTLPLGEEFAVYPNLLDVQKYDVLARKGLLREMGLRQARQLGRGTEFESLREYQPDD